MRLLSPDRFKRYDPLGREIQELATIKARLARLRGALPPPMSWGSGGVGVGHPRSDTRKHRVLAR